MLKKPLRYRRGFLSDPGRIQTFNLQSRNLMLYSVKLRDRLSVVRRWQMYGENIPRANFPEKKYLPAFGWLVKKSPRLSSRGCFSGNTPGHYSPWYWSVTLFFPKPMVVARMSVPSTGTGAVQMGDCSVGSLPSVV